MTKTDRSLISEVEQFYYREARMLDERQYRQWLALVTEDVIYRMPNRHIPQVDPKQRGNEEYLSVERELSHGTEPPLRDENYFILSVRVMRAFKQNSWTDNPPARTRRFVSNVEVLATEQVDCLRCYSNIMINYSRHQQDNYLFSAQRRDTLRRVDGELKIAARDVIIDWNVITAPTLGIFF
ncbi:Biphenyl dioxygenase subunit beta [Sinobacterium norvegicum]|uniref:Biphenyl dioxygenase subunit beta n=1 Tax=Sinobacterium norvegicum TaxID=1641715 RepID=A0ABN8ELF5_9GAMM|nr:aromatic-ring-hydroxylating dioxygenase subunit beta [Sinobacterium norvegicum]CAH0991995.1 Biphenyl dioxygenase subunit beta [Sinobacterium norvegicum]